MVIRVAVNNLITFNPRVWASWIIATSLNWIFKLKWIEWTSEISGVILCLNLVECYGINNVDDFHVYTGHNRIARAGWCPAAQCLDQKRKMPFSILIRWMEKNDTWFKVFTIISSEMQCSQCVHSMVLASTHIPDETRSRSLTNSSCICYING